MQASRDYEKGERLAVGGMGEIYAGTLISEHGVRTPVAIKQMRDDLRSDARAAERFHREAQLCASLDHPNVVSVLGQRRDEDGRLLLLLEYIDGLDLASLAEAGRMPQSVALYIIRAVLRALSYVHGQNVVHRDLSPHNVLISTTGAVKLADFGLARRMDAPNTDEHTIKGKLRYLSPEQIQGGAVDGRSDLFAVGVMLYELLTGRPPFAGSAATAHEGFAQMLTVPVVAPRALCAEISPEVEAVTLRLLQLDPDQRHASADDVLASLPVADDGAELAALMREAMATDGADRSPAIARPSGAPDMPGLAVSPEQRAAEPPAPSEAQPAHPLLTSIDRRRWPIAAGLLAVLLGVLLAVLFHPSSATQSVSTWTTGTGEFTTPSQDAPNWGVTF